MNCFLTILKAICENNMTKPTKEEELCPDFKEADPDKKNVKKEKEDSVSKSENKPPVEEGTFEENIPTLTEEDIPKKEIVGFDWDKFTNKVIKE